MKLPKLAIDLTGNTYGLLTVTKLAEFRIRNAVTWECQCHCGKTVSVPASDLKSGYKKSCGCLGYKPLKQQPILGVIKSITITTPCIVNRIVELAKESQTSPKTWAENVLEDWVLKHRSGRYQGDPARYDCRNEDTSTIYHE
jgi:hypothetical protein